MHGRSRTVKVWQSLANSHPGGETSIRLPSRALLGLCFMPLWRQAPIRSAYLRRRLLLPIFSSDMSAKPELWSEPLSGNESCRHERLGLQRLHFQCGLVGQGAKRLEHRLASCLRRIEAAVRVLFRGARAIRARLNPSLLDGNAAASVPRRHPAGHMAISGSLTAAASPLAYGSVGARCMVGHRQLQHGASCTIVTATNLCHARRLTHMSAGAVSPRRSKAYHLLAISSSEANMFEC
jgi:hypothetical protein